MIPRILQNTLTENLHKSKIILLLGARKIGKTTLLKQLCQNSPETLWLNAEDSEVRELFAPKSFMSLKTLFADKKIVVIDEAQRIEDLGKKLKLITDEITDTQIIITGSYNIELINQTKKVADRKLEYTLFPLSFAEMVAYHGLEKERSLLHHRLLYGYYPEVLANEGKEEAILNNIAENYIYNDIASWKNLTKPSEMARLLTVLATKVSLELKFNRMSLNLDIDNLTVEKYVRLLEQNKVIITLPCFHESRHKEIKTMSKLYFVDNGVRNALLPNFANIDQRLDMTWLWENFVVSERIKYLHYNNIPAKSYIWRNHDNQKVDYLEVYDDKILAFAIKWDTTLTPKLSYVFDKYYPNHEYKVINPDNYVEFIM